MINKTKPGTVVKHLKTDNLYVINGTALNCTNANDGQVLVIYANENQQEFVREVNEFWEKFEAVEMPEESRIITLN